MGPALAARAIESEDVRRKGMHRHATALPGPRPGLARLGQGTLRSAT
jgi:hypothetical protein